jgi:general secretion pathway protein A
MYTRYFGLTEKPFAISPNPRYLYMSELHREALAHLLYGIDGDGCLILLTGDVGTGKTTVCRCLLGHLPEKTDIAIILNPKLTARDLLRTICEELEILPGKEIASIKTYIDSLNNYLLHSHGEGRSTAVIIDEAQNLDINVLEQLRLLTNLETNTQKLLRIILIGQPELRDILNKPELSQVNQRITSRYHLTPLQPQDVKFYIQHRLAIAGRDNDALFSDTAIRHAAKLTNGIPRLINLLCDRALLGAYAESADHVDLRIMKKAGREIFATNSKKRSARRSGLVLTLSAIVLIIMISAVYLGPRYFTDTANTAEPTLTESSAPQSATNQKPPVQAITENTEQNNTIQASPPVHITNLDGPQSQQTTDDTAIRQ